MMLPMSACKKRLTILWFVGGGFLCFIVIVQTIFNHYGNRASDAWGWLLPTFMPTLSLIASVWSMDVLGKSAAIESVDRFVFWLAFALSLAYLLVVAMTILLQPFVSSSAEGYISVMNRSSLFLGPFQGVVGASLGVFFVKKQSEGADQNGR